MGINTCVAGCPRQVLVLPVRDVLTRPIVPVLFRQAKVNEEHLQYEYNSEGLEGRQGPSVRQGPLLRQGPFVRHGPLVRQGP